MSDAYRRTAEPYGVTLNYRTLEMLTAAVRKLGFDVELSQGSYSSGVSQSGGTHDGGGALDVRVRDLGPVTRDRIVYQLRRIGFAAWLRTPAQGDWPYHIHAVALGDVEASPAAKQQMVDYRNGLNGLANKGPDDGPSVPYTVYPQELDVSFYGPEHWDDADWTRYAEKGGWRFNVTDGRGTLRNADKLLSMIHTNGYEAEDAAVASTKAAVEAATAANAAQTAAAGAEQAVKDLEARLFPPA